MSKFRLPPNVKDVTQKMGEVVVIVGATAVKLDRAETLEDLTAHEREIVLAFLKTYPDYPVEQAIADMREQGL
jgi:hypothetical protein